MEAIQRILLTIGIVIVILAGFFLITEAITKYTGFSVTPENDMNSFKGCLKEKEIFLYVNTNNLADTLSELALVDYLAGVDIQNCKTDNSACLNKGIVSFPTWIVNDKAFYGDITKDELASLAGCIFTD